MSVNELCQVLFIFCNAKSPLFNGDENFWSNKFLFSESVEICATPITYQIYETNMSLVINRSRETFRFLWILILFEKKQQHLVYVLLVHHVDFALGSFISIAFDDYHIIMRFVSKSSFLCMTRCDYMELGTNILSK